MLVLVGPPFEGSEAEYGRLAQLTGLVAYDLKTKLKPGVWGVVRALGDEEQAIALASTLRDEGFRVAVVDPAVGYDHNRRMVVVRSLELGDSELTIHLTQRSMPIPYAALLTVVRGEVQVGARPSLAVTSSSSTYRAVVPSSSDLALFRESMNSGQFDAYACADLHFATVLWVARIDPRSFDFSGVIAPSGSPVADLDKLAELIAARADVRVDRGSRSSSVLSFTGRAGPMRSVSPAPAQRGPSSIGPSDERFDAYSRIVAEAERQTR